MSVSCGLSTDCSYTMFPTSWIHNVGDQLTEQQMYMFRTCIGMYLLFLLCCGSYFGAPSIIQQNINRECDHPASRCPNLKRYWAPWQLQDSLFYEYLRRVKIPIQCTALLRFFFYGGIQLAAIKNMLWLEWAHSQPGQHSNPPCTIANCSSGLFLQHRRISWDLTSTLQNLVMSI